MASDVQQMNSYLRRGRVDWVTETAGTGMLLQQRAGALPLLLTERDGVATTPPCSSRGATAGSHRSTDLRDAASRSRTRPRPAPTTCPPRNCSPRAAARSCCRRWTGRARSASAYVFARSELNISTWVHKRLVDVGRDEQPRLAEPAAVPLAFRRDFTVIARDAPIRARWRWCAGTWIRRSRRAYAKCWSRPRTTRMPRSPAAVLQDHALPAHRCRGAAAALHRPRRAAHPRGGRVNLRFGLQAKFLVGMAVVLVVLAPDRADVAAPDLDAGGGVERRSRVDA